jgi:hypothetical protein
MPSLTFDLNVEMEDGSTYQVVADQRDMAKWEVQPFGSSFQNALNGERQLLFTRWVAWSASVRRGLTELSWDDFDNKCVEVTPVSDGDGEVNDADPGNPAL